MLILGRGLKGEVFHDWRQVTPVDSRSVYDWNLEEYIKRF